MASIFISYRRSDSEYAAGRIYDSLASHFGGSNVFKDVDQVAPGMRWEDAIDTAMASASVLLVVIGPSWVSVTDDGPGGRRLDDPNDELRREVVKALGNYPATTVIPVLIGGATMPSADELPEDLRELTRRQARDVRGEEHFHSDVSALIYAIESVQPRKRRRAPKPVAVAEWGRGVGGRPSWVLAILGVILVLAVTGIALLGLTGVFDSEDSGSTTEVSLEGDTETTPQPSVSSTTPVSEPTTTPATATQAVATAPTTATPDNSAAAKADLERYFSLVRAADYSNAIQYFTAAYSPTFEDFVDYWNVRVESFDAAIDGCNVLGDRGVCVYRVFVSYSNLASDTFRNQCFGNTIELTMIRGSDRFLIDGDKVLDTLDC